MQNLAKICFIALVVIACVLIVHPPKQSIKQATKYSLEVTNLTLREEQKAMIFLRGRGFACNGVDSGYVASSTNTMIISCDGYKHKYSIILGEVVTLKEM